MGLVPEGQLRDHPRRRDGPELRVPALGHDRGRHPGARRHRPARSRSCSRRTPTTGTPPTPATTWKRRSTRTTTTSRPSCRRTTAWRPVWSQALDAVGLKIPVSGQDGDTAALNRVALGTQAVSVWKNAFALGQTAGSVAMQLCAGTALNAVKAPDDLPAAAAPASAQRHGVHDAGRQHRPVDHPHPDGDHQGQREGRPSTPAG